MFGFLGGLGGLGGLGLFPLAYGVFFVINLVIQLVSGNLNEPLQALFGGGTPPV